jgi:hypothetical protein
MAYQEESIIQETEALRRLAERNHVPAGEEALEVLR